ncbi:GNAT family N-acetyltransferase [Yinghuangia seranimata]|uniref:GNAT family N-acetyltransferase n=1 Tax=Yinghuangia seranimata TaxID=408067 RepID=UPI00248B9E76|nr:GNAT family N-acetyltransferase [Yinghuangia seranimata]MDI2125580.1 GNAT family N-acetyltransferase [Yinghuangia seranimata]
MVHFDSRVDKQREDWLGHRLEENNTAVSPDIARLRGGTGEHEEPLHLFAVDDDGTVVGGLTGRTWGHWLHVTLLWVAAERRGTGLGGELLARAETTARDEHDCHYVRLETWDFQAPEFYRKHGYEVVGEVPDYPPGVTEYILAKRLD